LQLSIDPITGQPVYKNWNWTAADSAQWTAYRIASDKLFLKLSDKKKSSTDIKDQMKILITTVKKYDHDPITGHHLLDKIAISGTSSDAETFRVKRGTALAATGMATAKKKGSSASGAVTQIPVLSMKLNSEGEHILNAINPDTPKSKAKPKGIKFLKVYRYIGTKPPIAISQYQFVANAKRGIAKSEFANIGLDANTKLWAWYIGRYESNKGVLGSASPALKAGILLQDETTGTLPTT
jgi:hypothetical protein